MSVAAAHHTANPLLAVKKHDAEAPPFGGVFAPPHLALPLRLNSPTKNRTKETRDFSPKKKKKKEKKKEK